MLYQLKKPSVMYWFLSKHQILWYFIYLYRSWSKIQDEFHDFLNTPGTCIALLITIIWDFNKKSKTWLVRDKPTAKENKTKLLTSQFGLFQIINASLYILKNLFSCIKLIFISLSNLLVGSRIHSLHCSI